MHTITTLYSSDSHNTVTAPQQTWLPMRGDNADNATASTTAPDYHVNILPLPTIPDDIQHAIDDDTINNAIAILEKRLARRRPITDALLDPATVRKFLRLKLATEKNEVFVALFLDNQHRLIESRDMFYGTIDGASVHPRVVVQAALELNAAAIVFAHNHPSGMAEPSQADRRITDRLKAALMLVDVRVLDHMIVGDNEVMSFAETGLI